MTTGRAPTGIPGLDALLQGGYPVNSSLALRSEASNMTEFFLQQFVMEGLSLGSQAIYCCMNRSVASVIESMRYQGFDAVEPVANDQLIFVDCYSMAQRATTIGVDNAIKRKVIWVENIDDERILQNGLASAVERVTNLRKLRAVCESVPATMTKKGAVEMMRWGRKTFSDLRAFETVTIHAFPSGIRDTIFEVMAHDFDGIIEIVPDKSSERIHYHLVVSKMRTTDHSLKMHELDIEKSLLSIKTEQRIT